MKMFAKDIVRTLFIKLGFLILLWFVCFKGAQKNTIDLSQWLYGVQMIPAVVQHQSFK